MGIRYVRGARKCVSWKTVKALNAIFTLGMLWFAVINTMTKNYSGRKGFLWLIVLGHTQSSKEVRAGTETEALPAHAQLAFYATLACLRKDSVTQ